MGLVHRIIEALPSLLQLEYLMACTGDGDGRWAEFGSTEHLLYSLFVDSFTDLSLITCYKYSDILILDTLSFDAVLSCLTRLSNLTHFA